MNQWAEQRLQFLGALVVGALGTALVFNAAREGGVGGVSVPPSLAAVALGSALTLGESMRWTTLFLVQAESTLASAERTSEYALKLDQEAAEILPGDGDLAVKGWPGSEAGLRLEALQVRYIKGMPLALRGLSCDLRAREKIGVVGRTGSGKTTLMSSLFRIVEPEGGRILSNYFPFSET